MAQELAPANSGLASSLPLGLSWAWPASPCPDRALADRISVAATLDYLALLPLVTAVLALFLPAAGPGPCSRPGRAEHLYSDELHTPSRLGTSSGEVQFPTSDRATGAPLCSRPDLNPARKMWVFS